MPPGYRLYPWQKFVLKKKKRSGSISRVLSVLHKAKRSIIYLFLMSPSGYSSLPIPVYS